VFEPDLVIMLIAAPSERPLAAEKRWVLTLNSSDRFTGQLHHWAAYGVSLLSTPLTVTLTLRPPWPFTERIA